MNETLYLMMNETPYMIEISSTRFQQLLDTETRFKILCDYIHYHQPWGYADYQRVAGKDNIPDKIIDEKEREDD